MFNNIDNVEYTAECVVTSYFQYSFERLIIRLRFIDFVIFVKLKEIE